MPQRNVNTKPRTQPRTRAQADPAAVLAIGMVLMIILLFFCALILYDIRRMIVDIRWDVNTAMTTAMGENATPDAVTNTPPDPAPARSPHPAHAAP